MPSPQQRMRRLNFPLPLLTRFLVYLAGSNNAYLSQSARFDFREEKKKRKNRLKFSNFCTNWAIAFFINDRNPNQKRDDTSYDVMSSLTPVTSMAESSSRPLSPNSSSRRSNRVIRVRRGSTSMLI